MTTQRGTHSLRSLRIEPLETRTLLSAAPTRSPYQISTADLYAQTAPDVAVASNGDFVAAWTGNTVQLINGVSTTIPNIFYRRYAANGTAKDAQQQNVALSADTQSAASVGVDAAGNFVVVWVDRNSSGDDDIYFQRFNASGVAQGVPTRVNTTAFSTTQQEDPHVAVAADGQFAVVWTHPFAGGGQDIYYRRFNANGTAKMASDAPVVPGSANSKQAPSVAINSNGSVAIGWTETYAYAPSVYFTVFQVDGNVRVAPTLVSYRGDGLTQDQASVSIDSRGYVDVAWQQALRYGLHDICVQRFDDLGVRRSASDLTIAGGDGDQDQPQIGFSGSQFVVGWREVVNLSQQTLYQLYGDDATPHGAVQNFQSGLTTNDFALDMNAGGEFALVVEHTVAGIPTIFGLNYRNSAATAGLASSDPTVFYLRNSNTTGMSDTAFRFSAAVSGLVPIVGDWNGDGVSTVGVYDPSTSFFALSNDNAAATLTFGFGTPGANWIPLAGDWNGDGSDTIGLYDPVASRFFLRDANSTGDPTYVFGFGPTGQQWLPIAGNWDGSGGDTIGLYNSGTSIFYLRNSLTEGIADLTFGFGTPGRGLRPIAGDWNNDGVATVGVYDGGISQFLLAGTNSSAPANYIFGFGAAGAGWKPVAGHWLAGQSDAIGLWDPYQGRFYLRNTKTEGPADTSFEYGLAGADWIPLAGDWNHDGVTTVGLYDPTLARFYLRNSNSAGPADVVFFFRGVPSGWLPVVGDWNADGFDTVGLYDPNASQFYFKNTTVDGPADNVIAFGAAGAGWKPLAGDWNGDGQTGVGLYNPVTSQFFLHNDPRTSGFADVAFYFGAPGQNWKPVGGDWNRDGFATVGLYDNLNAAYSLRNSNTTGVADVTFYFGGLGNNWTPVVGDWQGLASAALHTDVAATVAATPLLAADELPSVVAAALERWKAAGLSAAACAELAHTQFLIADLPDTQLAATGAHTIWIDRDAAGRGWYLDPQADADSAFGSPGADGSRKALDPTAVDRIDLLSVVAHELGHLAGLGDLDADHGLMSSNLGVGTRRLPSAADVMALPGTS